MAAGLGKRLRPLTYEVPKPMVPVGNRPVIELILRSLASHGVSEVVCNLHWFPEMIRARLGGLPVVDGAGQVVGMLGERELMRHLLDNYLHAGGRAAAAAHAPTLAPAAVRDVMTRQVLCVSPDQPIADVASIMTNKDVDRVPVVRDGRLVGFLTRGDIVRKLIGTQ